jgi:uncharacterized protein (TIGR02145 family)
MRNFYLLVALSVLFILSSCEPHTDTFTDERDGKTYKIVEIGNQIWFAENLAFKPSEGNFWAYEEDINNVDKYGYLYGWHTACKVCPDGWQLPTDEDWTILADYLGGDKIAGGKMKSKSGWEIPNVDATNQSGFSALPAGGKLAFDGSFDYLGKYTNFWSSTEIDDMLVSGFYLLADNAELKKHLNNKKTGFSVRCIKE